MNNLTALRNRYEALMAAVRAPISTNAQTTITKAARRKVAANDPLTANDNDHYTLPNDARSPLLIKGCGLEMLRSLDDKSVDLILADLPYNMSGLSIDPKIDLNVWLHGMHRVLTDRGAIVAFSAQPFTTDLMLASRAFDQGSQRFFKQELIWEKHKATNFQHSHTSHLKAHENIIVFSRGAIGNKRSDRRMTFYPQGALKIVKQVKERQRSVRYLANRHSVNARAGDDYDGLIGCPRSVILGPKDAEYHHSFQKPVWLLEYLIRTYSDENALIVDPTMGSGSAGIAAINTNRRFIGAENGIDKTGQCIFKIAENRIIKHLIEGIQQ